MYENYRELKIERRGRILRITIENPPLNPTTPVSHRELSRIFEDINHDRETDVVVLTGAGERAFSAGGDVGKMVERYEKQTMPCGMTRWRKRATSSMACCGLKSR